ncbi:MAG: hypothetical protein ACI8RD_010584, partial [Bacillariaceae sp.]
NKLNQIDAHEQGMRIEVAAMGRTQ